MVKGSERLMSFSISGFSYLKHLKWMAISSVFKTIESPLKYFFCGTIIIFHMTTLKTPRLPSLGRGLFWDVYVTLLPWVFPAPLPHLITHPFTGCSPSLIPFRFPFQWFFYPPLFLNHFRLYSGPHHSESIVLNHNLLLKTMQCNWLCSFLPVQVRRGDFWK